jgi:hypothetical protein
MKFWIACVVALGLAAQQACAAGLPIDEPFDTELMQEDAFGAITFFNTSNTASGITLIGALILLGVIAYLIWAGGLLFAGGNSGGSGSGYSSGYNRNGQGEYDPYAQPQYRSNNDAEPSFNVLHWISILQDLYEKFDYNDLECQKKVICEVMKEPDFYGTSARKFKDGFQYAKYLEVLSLPDDMRELLDEYLDANARSSSQKSCEEFFKCPYSIKESMSKNGNNSL